MPTDLKQQRDCPVCGTSNFWWAYFCHQCGYLEPSWNKAHEREPWPLESRWFAPPLAER